MKTALPLAMLTPWNSGLPCSSPSLDNSPFSLFRNKGRVLVTGSQLDISTQNGPWTVYGPLTVLL